jgi:hypothetical protein
MKPQEWSDIAPLVHKLAERIDLGEQLALSAREGQTRSWVFAYGAITVSLTNNQRVHDRLEKGYLADRAARLQRIEHARVEAEALKQERKEERRQALASAAESAS